MAPRPTPRYHTDQVVVSVEHARHDVPAEFSWLGLRPAYFQTHHGWDPGAATIGRVLSRGFSAPLHLGRWTRLVADLNRSTNHPAVVPRTTHGRPIPANFDLDRAQRDERIDRYWRPYRSAVESDLDAAVSGAGVAFHLSIHSFVERLRGEERRNHVGLLYEAWHRQEKALADRLHVRLADHGLAVRRNFPYSGRDDGFCMRMRRERPQRRYIGMEIELNQRWVRRPEEARRFGRILAEVLAPEFHNLEPA